MGLVELDIGTKNILKFGRRFDILSLVAPKSLTAEVNIKFSLTLPILKTIPYF
jgi:hypothetical protein